MKLPCKQVVKYLLLFFIFCVPFSKLTAQQFLTTINGWNAYVHLPDDYNLTGSQQYPTIIFFPGLGEVGSNPGAVIYYGPGSFIANGWNGNVVVNGVTIKPIIISLQPPAAFPQPSAIETRIQTIKSLYRVDPNRLHLTGLSHGGWCTSMYVMSNPTSASNIASIVAIQAMRPDDNPAYPAPFTTYAALGGHWLGYEQSADFRDMGTIANTMNAAVPGSATFIPTNIAGGGHCCWNYWYDPNHTDNYVLNGVSGNWSIYQYMLSWSHTAGPPAVNLPPVAIAGNDVIINLPATSVTLNGSGTDADGTISTYSWTQVSGPSQFNIVTPAAAQTIINNLVQGVYQFQLSVTDNSGATATDIVVVTVNAASSNVSPVSNAGTDITITLPTNSAVLNGTGTDADGTISTYTWTKITGPAQFNIVTPAAAQTTVNNLIQGVYWFQLQVTDNNGATAIDAVIVTVNAAPPPPPNQAPVAIAGNDITITLPANSVTFNGSGTDADGTIASYAWTKTSGPAQFNIVTPAAAQTTINNLVQGVYWFQLQVTDNTGATAVDVVVVTVNAAPPPNQAPVANAGNDITITLPANSVTLNGSGTDADGTIASYTWTKTSGPAQFNIVTASAAQTTVNNLVQGVYWFELRVTDNNSATAVDSVMVTVNTVVPPPPPPNQSPVANAGNDITITLPANSVTLNGSGTDADGTIASYSWTKTSGPAQFNIVTASVAQTTVNNLVQGVYWFELRVTDNNGATAVDVIVVTVNAAPPPPPNQSPVSNAGSDITITLPANSVVLNGSGTDADGTIASYTWTKTSGPAQFNIVTAAAAQTTVNNLVQGVYWFELRVTDNNGATALDVVIVTVNAAPPPPPNQAPVANAGNDVSITLPVNSAVLNGVGTDADGTIGNYFWTKVSGPVQFNIVTPGTAQTTINNLVQGVYKFELRVTDNVGATSRDSVNVTVNAAGVVNCGCDVLLQPAGDGGIYLNMTSYNLQPGAKVCIQAGNYTSISLEHINGTAAQPITIINCGGPVTTGSGGNYGIRIIKGKYFRLTGTGDPNHQYGFKILGPPSYLSSGLAIADSSSDFEIDHIEVSKANVGFFVKTHPQNCNPGTWGDNDNNTMRNVSLHDNYIHNTRGEGFYIGSSFYTMQVLDCNGNTITVEAQKIRGLKIYNNITDTTEWDGIQVGNAPENVEIYNNVVKNFGTINMSSQQAGIIMGGKTSGKIYNNFILNGTGNGMQVMGFGNLSIYNNLIVNAGFDGSILGQDAVIIDDRPTPGFAGPKVFVMNNTVVNAARNGFLLQNSYGTFVPGSLFYNNLIIKSGAAGIVFSPSIADSSNNVIKPQIVDAGFVNAAGNNYHLATGSIAIDAGRNVIPYGIAQDYDGSLRPYGASFDVGAYEFVSGAPPANLPPIANAGNDRTISLPLNSTIFSGSGTDADGAIVGYSWSKISGPAQFNIVTPSAAQTTINNLVQGVYQFELTVTDNNGATDKDTVAVTVNAAPPPVNQLPVANAGYNISIVLPSNLVSLSGSGTDADGTIVSYAWTKILGPAQFNIVNPTNALTVVNGLVEGIYQFQLRVTDNSGGTGVDTILVTVFAAPPPPVNLPPVANAGFNISITLPSNIVSLSGSGTDADGIIVSYDWTKISGPAQFTIVNPAGAVTNVNNLVEGVYLFQLQVTDNGSATDVDTIMVTVYAAPPPPPPPPVNQPPVANAGISISITLPTNLVTLTGSGTDADGTIVSYNWTKILGPAQFNIINQSSAQTNVDNLVEGVYQFQLRVTDNDGATDVDTITVTVLPASAPNQPPIADAGNDISINLPINSAVLNGGGTDGDGTIISYSWRKISGPSSFNIISAAQPQSIVSDLIQGTYSIELTVTDNDGASGKDTVSVYVDAPPNRRPVANAGDNRVIMLPQNSVLLEGNGSDPDGSITEYNWREISGPGRYRLMNPAYPQTLVDDLEEGTYAFELEVTDNNGERATDTVEITVKNIPESRVIIYPNPVRSIMNIQIDANTHASMTLISIYDVNGKVVHRQSFMRNQSSLIKQVDISHLPNGGYFVEVTADINRKITTKIIKQ